jgi:hypothetical protein
LGVPIAKLAIAIWSNEPLKGENRKKILKKRPSGMVNKGQKYMQKRPANDLN